MSDQAKQSEDYILPDEVRYIAQADYGMQPDMLMESRPQRTMDDLFEFIADALFRDATAIRIFPAAAPKPGGER